MHRAFQWSSVAAFILAAFVGSLIYVARSFRSEIYCVEATFTVLPSSDERLTNWLKDQPGVLAHTVRIERRGANNMEVQIGFLQTGSLFGRSAFPHLEEKCVELGYEGSKAKFRDCRDHYR